MKTTKIANKPKQYIYWRVRVINFHEEQRIVVVVIKDNKIIKKKKRNLKEEIISVSAFDILFFLLLLYVIVFCTFIVQPDELFNDTHTHRMPSDVFPIFVLCSPTQI